MSGRWMEEFTCTIGYQCGRCGLLLERNSCLEHLQTVHEMNKYDQSLQDHIIEINSDTFSQSDVDIALSADRHYLPRREGGRNSDRNDGPEINLTCRHSC